jgi:hypothetical protein
MMMMMMTAIQLIVIMTQISADDDDGGGEDECHLREAEEVLPKVAEVIQGNHSVLKYNEPHLSLIQPRAK